MFRIPMRRSLGSWRNYRSGGSALDGYNSYCKISHELWMEDNGVRFQEARKHNKEMHCQNGNIDFCAERGESSVMVIQRCRKEAWEMPVIKTTELWDTALLLKKQEDLFQQKTYRDTQSNYISSYPSHSGTLHYPTKLLGSSMMMDSDVVRVLAQETTPQCPLLCGCKVTKKKVEEACRKQDKETVPYDKIPATERKIAKGKIRRALDEEAEKYAADFIVVYPSLEASLKASTSTTGPVSSRLCKCRVIQYYNKQMAGGWSAEGELVGEGLPSDILKFAFNQDLLGVKDDLKWVGVGIDIIKCGRLVLMDEYQQLLTTHKKKSEVWSMSMSCNLLQKSPIYGHLKAAGLKAVEMNFDWRRLGIKVALYDDLRERRSTPPTGVEWAVNAKTVWQREIIFSNHFSDPWGYEAIATNLTGMEQCVRNNWNVFFNDPENGDALKRWRIWDDNTVVIFLHTVQGSNQGLETWILSHLNYPLAGVAETFKIYDIRDIGDGTSRTRFTDAQGRTQVFLRNSSLVDVRNSARKIVFVVMNNSSTQVTLGGVTLKVNFPNDKKFFAAPYAFDDALRAIVRKVLESSSSLKTDFSVYTRELFANDIDWREIDLLVAYLTTRWHPQPEGLSEGSGNDEESQGESRRTFSIHHCPKETGRYYCEGAPEKNPLTDPWDYGQRAAALGFDHAVGPQASARQKPALFLGCWTTLTEISLGLIIAKYNPENKENAADISMRQRAGGWDRLLRATYMRIGFEEWKKEAGIRDGVLAPRSYYPGIIAWWRRLISLWPAGSTADSIASMICTNTVEWSWGLNLKIDIPATLTGMRTSVDMKKSYLSCELTHEPLSKLTEGRYNFMNSATWFFDKYTRCDGLGRELKLDRLLMRINVNDWHNHISYDSWPDHREITRFAVRSENRMSHVLHKRAGWEPRPIGSDNIFKGYSWGVPSHLKLWESGTYVTVALDKEILARITTDVFYAGTWLACPPSLFH